MSTRRRATLTWGVTIARDAVLDLVCDTGSVKTFPSRRVAREYVDRWIEQWPKAHVVRLRVTVEVMP